MGLTLTGTKVKIYKKMKEWSGGTFATYSMSVSSKDKDGNWVNGYLDCLFKKGIEVNNKAVIEIKNAFPSVAESNGRKFVKWFIADFEVTEVGESDKQIDTDGFMTIPDGADDELPFK